ncbi:hypothetical protein ACM46_08380 [Chryseobacterium angstadtii]|uniref:Uncharacterized protein n=1 Tax=Chryseobacterium angstadtii TaxID=558151 RepID=A0A0J7IEG8_9FLAO|nr:hypothetical protein [Chryseobacterium angstadtii]KMQ64301.1 hypothetical protein ACM46_08380 [Chryseobacterium angstadtii]
MKKILLAAAITVNALVSAKGTVETKTTDKIIELKTDKNFVEEIESLNTKMPVKTCSQWYIIDSGCGKDYYLCGDNYSSPQQMHQAMAEIN